MSGNGRMRRHLIPFVLALALAGCTIVSGEERQLALAYLENAAQYYDAGHYPNAFQQWGKVLAIDPDEQRAQLGQAMAQYQMGQRDTKEGISHLTDAERRLEALRDGALGDQSWKAELGYALVQQRWADLYDKAARLHEANQAAGRPFDAVKLATSRAERPRRIALAEAAFQTVRVDERTLPNFQLTVWLGLARLTAMRGAYEESLGWCRKYEEQVSKSREYWARQSEEYASKLFGAELQEAELRDVLGNTLFKLGRFAEAEKELDRLVVLQPARAAAYLNRAILREARGAWDLARSDYDRFLQLADLASDDPSLLEAEKRRLLCEDRLAAEDARMEQTLPPPR